MNKKGIQKYFIGLQRIQNIHKDSKTLLKILHDSVQDLVRFLKIFVKLQSLATLGSIWYTYFFLYFHASIHGLMDVATWIMQCHWRVMPNKSLNCPLEEKKTFQSPWLSLCQHIDFFSSWFDLLFLMAIKLLETFPLKIYHLGRRM